MNEGSCVSFRKPRGKGVQFSHGHAAVMDESDLIMSLGNREGRFDVDA